MVAVTVHSDFGAKKIKSVTIAVVLPVARKLLKRHLSPISLHSSSFGKKKHSVHSLRSPLAFFLGQLWERNAGLSSLFNFMQSSRFHLYLGDHGSHGLWLKIYIDIYRYRYRYRYIHTHTYTYSGVGNGEIGRWFEVAIFLTSFPRLCRQFLNNFIFQIFIEI